MNVNANAPEGGSRQGSQAQLLAGKITIITGASRGIGAVAARAFAAAGATVVLAARDEQGLAAVANGVQSAGGRALVVSTDVSDPDAVAHLVRQTMTTFGRLDAAFNNAGWSSPPTPLADISVDDFDAVVRVNLRGVFLALKAEIPAMLASGGGAIVNMSSTAGANGAPGIAAYVASKHGVIGLTKTAALDYAERNIRVNALAPGSTMNERIARLPDEVRERIASGIPMRRIARPEEIAAVAVWLCSDAAAYVTGAVIPIDGGRLARNP